MTKYKKHQDALYFIRKTMFLRKLTYQEVADELSDHTPQRVTKAEAWNAEHRDKRCAPHIKYALVQMGLLEENRRWRFFYEVDENTYHRIEEYLNGKTFTQYMRERSNPWG